MAADLPLPSPGDKDAAAGDSAVPDLLGAAAHHGNRPQGPWFSLNSLSWLRAEWNVQPSEGFFESKSETISYTCSVLCVNAKDAWCHVPFIPSLASWPLTACSKLAASSHLKDNGLGWRGCFCSPLRPFFFVMFSKAAKGQSPNSNTLLILSFDWISTKGKLLRQTSEPQVTAEWHYCGSGQIKSSARNITIPSYVVIIVGDYLTFSIHALLEGGSPYPLFV